MTAARRRRSLLGVTVVELYTAVALVGVLSAAAMPMARTVRVRVKEKELKRALHDIRSALDEYRKDWVEGCIESPGGDGWPETLEELTQEFDYRPLPGSDGGPVVATKKVYMKTVPVDPFNLDGDEWDVNGWRARAYEDEIDDDGEWSSWGGENVYDVRSGSDRKALDGTPYGRW